MKYIVYLIILAVVGVGAWLVRGQMAKGPVTDAQGNIQMDDQAPGPSSYAAQFASQFDTLATSAFKYATLEALPDATQAHLGDQQIADRFKPLLDAGWGFKGARDGALPGMGNSVLVSLEKAGARLAVFGQKYHASPDLSAHRNKTLTIAPPKSLASGEIRMFWNGGGVVMFIAGADKAVVESAATAMGWPAVSGSW
jgi:hypothetical protein